VNVDDFIYLPLSAKTTTTRDLRDLYQLVKLPIGS
jgi:hypothetical protein